MAEKKGGKPDGAPLERRKRVATARKVDMLATVIRNPEVFEMVRDVLKVEFVQNDIGDAYSVVYRAVRSFYARFGELPAKSILLVELQDRIAANPKLLFEDEHEAAYGFIDAAYANRKRVAGKQFAAFAVETCKRFLEDQAAVFLRESSSGGKVPVNLAGLITTVQADVETLSSIDAAEVDALYPPGWDEEKQVALFSTGVASLDHFLGGGHCGSEIYTLMGPYGSCKTTIAIQAVVNSAKEAAALYSAGATPGGRRPVAVYVSTETPRREFGIRAMAFAAGVPRDLLAGMKSLNDVPDDADNPSAYEKRHYRDQLQSGDGFITARQRCRNWEGLAGQHVLFVDFTDGNRHCSNAGVGGPAELDRTIRALLRKAPDIYPMVFWLDHASALAMRMLIGANLPPDQLRFMLKRIPLECRDLLAKKYDAPFWILHQLDGQANKCGPNVVMHYSDAADCKSFVEFADFSFEVGKGTGDQLHVLGCSKHRRQPPRPTRIIQIRGGTHIVDRAKTYVLDPNRRGIVTRESLTTHSEGGKGGVSTKKAKIKEAKKAAVTKEGMHTEN